WSSFAIAAPHPTWNGDYQRTSFKNVSLKANSPYGLLPSHALLIEDHLYSYSTPVFDDTYMYIYLYDSNETAYLRAYRLSDIFSRSGDIKIPHAWQFKIPSKRSSYRNSVECYYGESVSIAHCGEASAVSAPSLFTWNGRKMLTIGIGVRIYVFDISGNTPALIAMGHLVNLKQPNAVHQISLSPLFASGWIFAGGWQGVFYGWSMSCLLQGNCVPGETYIGINLADIGLGGHVITSSPS